MFDLIDTLEAQHRQIMAHLEAIREANYARDVALRELQAARILILQHLELEDRALYRPLLAHPECEDLAADCQTKMHGATQEILAFFAGHDLDAADATSVDFPKHLGHLMRVLGDRVRQEEARLYPMFRQLGRLPVASC